MVLLALEDRFLVAWFRHQLRELSELLQVQKRAVNNLVTCHHLVLENKHVHPYRKFFREINSSALCILSVPRKFFVDKVE